MILDAATGTELSRRGLDTSPPLWSARALAEHPDVVVEIHREALRAGAGMLTSCTFRTQERTLRRAGWGGRADELNALAVRCAREAAAREGASPRVAGSLAPLEDCFRPDLVPAGDALAIEHAAQARSLRAAGVDLILVETMGTTREAVAATRAAVATGLPAWCSFTTSAPGVLLSAEPLRDAVRAAQDEGAEAILINCTPWNEAAADVAALADVARVPFGIEPNVGHGRGTPFDASRLPSLDAFAEEMARCAALGATLLGGCCGTGASHVAALRGMIGA